MTKQKAALVQHQQGFKDKLEIEGVNANGYGIMPKIVMQDNRLTIEAKAIYAYIVSYAGAGNTAFPSLKKILSDLGISKTRFYKHRLLLIDCNYITVKAIKNEKNEIIKNLYTLIANPVRMNNGGMAQNEEYPIPQNKEYSMAQNEEHIINNTKINSIKINKEKKDTKNTDTKKLEKIVTNQIDFSLTKEQRQEQELLENFSTTHEDHSFLTEQNLNIIALFSESLLDAENMQGIILRAKKAMEKEHDTVLVIDNDYMQNELLDVQQEITKTLRRIYQKRKTDSTIKNIDNYAYGAFKNLFDSVIGNWKILVSENQTGNSITTHNWVN